MKRRLFCEINPFFYKISVEKEILRRKLRDMIHHTRFAETRKPEELLPHIVKGHTSPLIRRLHGVDIALQENKAENIRIASGKVNGLVIFPGETFSFWHTAGRPRAKDGYKNGLVIAGGQRFESGVGGGMCQMANLIHWLVLNSPLTVTELHHHSDALFPDERRRIPFGTGTSIFYNYIDYRFRNDTDQPVQLVLWIENGELCGEMRSERAFPYRYKLVEENHHFRKEGTEYYRISQVYRLVIDRETNETIEKELLLDNHSRVLYDHNLIPAGEIRNE